MNSYRREHPHPEGTAVYSDHILCYRDQILKWFHQGIVVDIIERKDQHDVLVQRWYPNPNEDRIIRIHKQNRKMGYWDGLQGIHAMLERRHCNILAECHVKLSFRERRAYQMGQWFETWYKYVVTYAHSVQALRSQGTDQCNLHDTCIFR